VIRSRRTAARLPRLLVLAIAALIPVLAGCEAGNNAATQQWHQPTDGAGTVQDNIAIRNVFVLGAPIGATVPAGQSAGVFLALINDGSPDTLLKITASWPGGGPAGTVTLPGGAVGLARQQAVLLTGPEPKVILEDLTRPLVGGSSVVLKLIFQNAAAVTLQVPVLPQAQYYSTYSPPPTPTPTPTPGRQARHRARPAASPSP
jgi:copper(I)-binding protein